jgi:hypothetical protein
MCGVNFEMDIEGPLDVNASFLTEKLSAHYHSNKMLLILL